MGPQHFTVSIRIRMQVKSVVHLTCRMLFRDIQRREIVEIGFQIGPFGNIEAKGRENFGNFIHNLADGMQTAFCPFAHRKTDINRFIGQSLVQRGLLKGEPAGGDGLCHIFLEAVQRRAGRAPFLGAHPAKAAHPFGHPPLFAKRADTEGFQRLQRLHRGNGRLKFSL